MIKIIQGTFGLRVNNTIVPKTVKDEPFSCDKATEKRLVAAGIAEYIEEIESVPEVEAEAEVETEVETEETEVETEVETEETEVKTEDNKVVAEEPSREELIAAFKELGLKGNPAVMRDETLKAKIAEAAELVEDEEAPVFEAVDGVVQ